MTSPDLLTCARLQLTVALGLIELRDATASHLARAALDTPGTTALHALLVASTTAEWRPMLTDALSHLAVAAADEILGGDA